MKFDIQHASADPRWTPAILSPAAVTRFAQAAEAGGYASIGFTDHPAPSARWVRNGGEGSADPFSALAFCAAVTSTIRLLTWVLVLPYRNPLLTAHQSATLDALSGGRLILGVGTGYLRSEFRALGADFDSRREVFDEAIELIQAAWTGKEIDHEGIGFTAHGTLPQPGPVQRPGPPLWVHGNSRWGRERAARHGDGWVGVLTSSQLAQTMRTAAIPDLKTFAACVEDLRARTEEAGREPNAVEVVVSGNWPLLDVRKGWDTEQLLDDVGKLAESGANRVVVAVCGDDPGATEDTVRRFGAEIIGSDPGAR